MGEITRQLRITGLVQGVAYRAWTQGMAHHLGLSGWVRNEGDGSVKALISGPEQAVDEMITACWDGPGAARVTNVQVTPAEAPVDPGFSILR